MADTTPTSPDLTSTDASDAWAALPPLPDAVHLPSIGRTLQVSPLKLGELPAFAAAVAPMASAVQVQLKMAAPDWVGLAASHGERCIRAMAIAARTPEAELADLDLADSVTLLEAILSSNADFFARQVLPRLSTATARLSSSGSTWRKPSPP